MEITEQSGELMIIRYGSKFSFFGLAFIILGIVIILAVQVLIPMIIAVIFAIIGAYIIISSKAVTITLDKNSNKISVLMEGLVNKQSKDYKLSEATAVELRQRYETSYKNQEEVTNIVYDLVLVLQSTEFVVSSRKPGGFNIGGLSMSLDSSSPERDNGQKISDFLGIEFNEIRPPSVTEVLGTVKDTLETEMKKRNREM